MTGMVIIFTIATLILLFLVLILYSYWTDLRKDCDQLLNDLDKGNYVKLPCKPGQDCWVIMEYTLNENTTDEPQQAFSLEEHAVARVSIGVFGGITIHTFDGIEAHKFTSLQIGTSLFFNEEEANKYFEQLVGE